MALRITLTFADSADVDEQQIVNEVNGHADEMSDRLDLEYDLTVELVDEHPVSGIPVDRYGMPLS